MSMTTLEVANRLTELVKSGDYVTPYAELYSPEIVSVEGADGQQFVGMEAIEAKNRDFAERMEIHGGSIEGPFPSGDKFGLIYDLEMSAKGSEEHFNMKELAIYTVADGKIVHEQFFYSGN